MMPAMHEIELRFHVPAEQRERLRRFVARGGKARSTPLAAIYYDSEARELARAGIGLRLRREGEQWVQTVKGPSEDGISRLEHNANVDGEPRLDLDRHAGHPLGERLARLRQQGLGELRPVFSTEILRTHRRCRLPGGELELCWDEGELRAGDAAPLPVHELELELLHGEPSALLAHAHGLVARWPLSLDLRSKAERGENLARGQRRSAPRLSRLSRPSRSTPRPGPFAALRALLLDVFDPLAHNASQLGCGDSEPEHLRQLRLGLQRLHSGLRRHRQQEPALDLPALRDFEARAAGCLLALPGAGGRRFHAQAAADAVREPGLQQFLVEYLGWLYELDRLDRRAAACPT